MQKNGENVNQREEQDVSVQYDFSIKFSNNSKSQNLLVNTKALHSEDETIKSERDSRLLNGSKKTGNYGAVSTGESLRTTHPSNCYGEGFIDQVVNQDNTFFEPVKRQDKFTDGRNVNPTGKEIQNVIVETSLISSNSVDEGLENKIQGSCDDQGDIESTELSTSTFSFRALSSRHKLILISISLCSFLSYLCLSLIAPFFPSEAASKNVSNSVSGWIFGIFALTQFLISPVSGKLLPLMGLKFMYIGGLFIAAGCTVLFGILTYIDTGSDNITFIIYCFLLRIILAIGCCGLQTASFALVAKEFPDSVATVCGITEVFVGVGFMSGPAIGGFLYGSGGFIMPFAVVGAIMFLCVPFNFWLIPGDTVVEKSSSSKISFWVMMKSPKTIINSFSTLVAAMIFSILDPTLEPHLSGSFNLEADIIGLLFLLMAACYAIMSPIAGWICDKLPDNRGVLIPGFFISAVGMLFLGPSEIFGLRDLLDDQLWLNIVSLIVSGIGSSLALVPTFDIYVSIAEELGFDDDLGMYGIVAGLWGSFYALGDFLGPTIGGTLLDIYGFPFCCTITAGACLFMVPLLLFSWLYDTRCCRQNSLKTNPIISETTPLLSDALQDYEH
ncbi:MFS-type transporter SLC18B1-like isoform X2 [Mytilus californianus]|uniref:MFS-type transporter SLC18B1-like isoform X2 n=1 Tax=Mytilus californianus TaxID=6549 RepID=UPI0022459953|nr:MFS-type transporter SLC18B1-like isoform X2 [Mytilus californianus]